MKTLKEYLDTIHEESYRLKLEEILQWIETNYPSLNFKIAWNQPMYTHHETFIIAFSVAKKHIAVSPEIKGIQMFLEDIEKAGYTHGSNLFRIKWNDEIDYPLLDRIIKFNIEDKADCTSFWRK